MDPIPAPTIRRLSLYLRQLEECATCGERTISSKQLGEKLSLSDTQVRKDLAHFGPFGHPGIGYRVLDLIPRIRQILGTDKIWPVILVGCGNLGRALAAYKGFVRKGFVLEAVFDNDPAMIGRALPGLEGMMVRSIGELGQAVSRGTPMLGILAVPADSAQAVADQMITAGIRGILNFAPVALRVPPDVGVIGVDLAVHLEQLSFQVGGMASEVSG